MPYETTGIFKIISTFYKAVWLTCRPIMTVHVLLHLLRVNIFLLRAFVYKKKWRTISVHMCIACQCLRSVTFYTQIFFLGD